MSSVKKTTAEIASELAKPLLEELGLSLWDVTYGKEGTVYILRYLIDKEGGVDITDCENFSRGVEILLDEADPVAGGYTLEVSSPGIERELTKPEHFEKCIGMTVAVRLYRAVEGVKDFVGKLTAYSEGTISILIDEEDDIEMQLTKAEAAFIRLYYEF